MFSDMRRKDREISKDQCESLLREAEHGVLSLNGTNGYPHPVPMCYAYKDGCIWLHGSKEGTRAAAMKADNRCVFTVAETLKRVQDKFTVQYRSVILYGQVTEVFGDEAKAGLFAIIEKYSPDFLNEGLAYIDRSAANICVLKLTVEHMTGKARQ